MLNLNYFVVSAATTVQCKQRDKVRGSGDGRVGTGLGRGEAMR